MGVLEERANLPGKIAIVVGGAQRIGAKVCLDLARSGVHVAFCDNDESALASTERGVGPIRPSRLRKIADALDSKSLVHFFDPASTQSSITSTFW